MRLRLLAGGISTYLPGVKWHLARGTGGTDSARYCYSVWLRHLAMAKRNGLDSHPKMVAELGPGDSLGIGLAALISGSEKYFALDIVDHANIERNVSIFDELVFLFGSRSAIPGDDEFPEVKPRLGSYSFPVDILDEDTLHRALDESRIKKIRNSIMNHNLANAGSGAGLIEYKVPWYGADVIQNESVDMVFSQAVLEHVDDLRNTYRAMNLWLKRGGIISHQIDFRCHGTAKEWNGHLTYSDLTWKIIRGKRPYLINREPHSVHLSLLRNEGFDVVCDEVVKSNSCIDRGSLSRRFIDISDGDLTISGAFIQGTKK